LPGGERRSVGKLKGLETAIADFVGLRGRGSRSVRLP
jgi:hypothetical protein